ncbi:MAG: carbohydrate kinase [Synergistaceae bacterium]|nr:carbohydrate kinase [Synergistaceae bacterium]
MGKVICAGDILYDFISTERGLGLAGSTRFEKKQGGSPFNIAIGLARLGVPVGFLVKIGDDEFGRALRDFLVDEGVDDAYIVDGAGHNTTLAMAAIDSDGKPEFRFYRDNSADVSLSPDELPQIDPGQTSVFQLGSICLADNPVGEAHMRVFESMRSGGVMTVLDPNVRPLYVEARPVFRERITSLMKIVDVLKMSDDDLRWIAGDGAVEDCLDRLGLNHAGLVIVTEGGKGARAVWRGETIKVPGYSVEVAETTGCGDSFMAGFISKLAPLGRSGFENMTTDFLRDALVWANACAAIVATRRGAAGAMPRRPEVEEFLTKG